MISAQLIRTCSALIAGTALFAGVATAAGAVDSFNVSTTITDTCTVTDSGPANLTPTYTPATDSGTGSETTLNTFCNGIAPTVTFSDSASTNTSEFVMSDGANPLFYQISNTATCSGIAGDNPIIENTPNDLAPGNSTYAICAAVIAGVAVNNTAPAGTYNDTVIYSIAP